MRYYLSALSLSFMTVCVVVSLLSATTNLPTLTRADIRGNDLILIKKHRMAMYENGFKITFSQSIENLYNKPNSYIYPENFENGHQRVTVLLNIIDDSGFRIIVVLYQEWKNETWVNRWKDTITYDANQNPIELIDQAWINGT